MNSPSISTFLKTLSSRSAIKISIWIFVVLAITLSGIRFKLKTDMIRDKIQMDSNLIVQSIKIGDRFFLRKYLSSLAESGAVRSAQILDSETGQPIDKYPVDSTFVSKPYSGTSLSLKGLTFSSQQTLSDASDHSWFVGYSIFFGFQFLLLPLFLATTLGLIILIFQRRLLMDLGTTLLEPLDALQTDFTEFYKANNAKNFVAKNYQRGTQFDEIDTVVSSIENMLEKIQEQDQQLRESEVLEAKIKLSRQVSHDIQSPIGALKAAVGNKSAEKAKVMALVEKAVNRIEYIAQNLSVVAEARSTNEVETSTSQIETTKVDIGQTIEKFLPEKEAELSQRASKPIKISFTPPKEMLYAKINEKEFETILSNILNNAFESIPEDREPEIKISCEKHQKRIMIQITDNGKGIPSSLKEKVFEYGFSKDKKGSGLGLHHAKKIIESWDGSIGFEVGSEYTGARLTISMPQSVL